MADEAQQTLQAIRSIHWREVFPFTNLFRAFRVAVHPSKLILGLLGLLTLYVGGVVLDSLWPSRHLALPGEVDQNANYRGAPEQSPGGFDDLLKQQRLQTTEAYADMLQRDRIVADRSAALAAAAGGEHKDKLKGNIAWRQNEALRLAAQARDAAVRAAQSLQGDAREQQLRRARETYREQVRAAYETAARERRALDNVLPHGIFFSFFRYQARQINNVVNGVLGGNWLGGVGTRAGPPVVAGAVGETPGVVQSVINFLVVGPSWFVGTHPVYFVLYAILFLLVWAVFGGAIARIAAVHVARDEKISVRSALAFSVSKLLSFVFAPLIPLLIVLIVGLVLGAGGLLYYIPVIGPIVAGLFFVLALLAGVVMALVLLGTIGGFNLMYPTIAVEGSDSFDAISRSFSYVFARPWRMLFYTALAVVYGALTYLFVRFFIWLVLATTHFFVSWFLYRQPGAYFPEMWPAPAFGELPYEIHYKNLAWSEDVAAGLMSFWIYLVIALLGAYAISFYFSANTIIYYLMRREVDATELDDVYVEETDEDFGEAPPVTEPTAERGAATGEPTTPAFATGAAPASGTTSAPGGGTSGTAGSSAAGGAAGIRVYNTPDADAPKKEPGV
jgi:hypothetical protein